MSTGTSKVRPLIEAERIARRIRELAHDIARDPGGPSGAPGLVCVVLLKGAFVFAADLLRALDEAGLTPEVEFMSISSYGHGTSSSGVVTLESEPRADLHGRHVLVVDDILDSGRSLAWTCDYLRERGAASVRSCVLLDKPSRRVLDVRAEFVGFEIPDRFVVGYGVDHAERYRHLPYVGFIEG